MAQEQILEHEIMARACPGQDGREQQPEQFKHAYSIADLCRARFCRRTTSRTARCPTHIPVTVPEIRRLLVRLLSAAVYPRPTFTQIVAWSRWRRHHQKIAQDCHKRRRLKPQREL